MARESLSSPIVHIGYHKTASTWFQRSVYPLVRNFAYVPRERVKRAFFTASAFHFDPSWTREQLQLRPDAPPILCEEELSGYLHTGGLQGYLSKEMAHRIQRVFPDARIVIFVRSQPEMIAACYQQYLRGGGTYRPRRYLWPADALSGAAAAPYKIPRFSFDHFEYDLLAAHYVSLFGRERVHVFAYEELARDTGTFLDRFSRELSLELDCAAVPMERQNVSYSLAVAHIARALNRFTARTVNDKRYWFNVPGWYKRRRRLVEFANRSGLFGRRAPAEALLGEHVLAWIRQRYWESNRRLAALVTWDPAALGYPMQPPPAPVPRPARPRWLRWTTK
jgi:hypothetical protein